MSGIFRELPPSLQDLQDTLLASPRAGSARRRRTAMLEEARERLEGGDDPYSAVGALLGGPSLTAREPQSMRERLNAGVDSLGRALGMDERSAASLARGIAGVPAYSTTGRAGFVDMTPVGSLMSMQEGRQQFGAGEQARGALNMALGAADVVPGVGEAVGALGKALPLGAMAAGAGSRSGREAMQTGTGSLAERIARLREIQARPEPPPPVPPVRPGVNAKRLTFKPGYETIDGQTEVNVFRNPSRQMIDRLASRSGYGKLRTYQDPEKGDVYVWDAGEPLEHRDLARQVGARFDERASGYIDAPRTQRETDGLRSPAVSGQVEDFEEAQRRGSVYTPEMSGIEPATLGARYEPTQNLADAEGRPLRARYVVGRHMEGGSEQALAADEATALVRGLTGNDPQRVPRSQIRNRADGSFSPGESLIRIADDLDDPFVPGTLRHEAGHMLDRAAGMMSDARIAKELDLLFKEGSPRRGTRGVYSPRDAGYPADEVRGERVAEALRIYMEHPGYIKQVAPKTASRIRKLFNDHPRVAEWIQFNGLAGLAALGGGTLAAGLASQPAEAQEN